MPSVAALTQEVMERPWLRQASQLMAVPFLQPLRSGSGALTGVGYVAGVIAVVGRVGGTRAQAGARRRRLCAPEAAGSGFWAGGFWARAGQPHSKASRIVHTPGLRLPLDSLCRDPDRLGGGGDCGGADAAWYGSHSTGQAAWSRP